MTVLLEYILVAGDILWTPRQVYAIDKEFDKLPLAKQQNLRFKTFDHGLCVTGPSIETQYNNLFQLYLN